MIRAFLRAPDLGNHNDTKVFDAFWTVVYSTRPGVDHETASRVEWELMHSDRLVGEVLDGWRPLALSQREPS